MVRSNVVLERAHRDDLPRGRGTGGTGSDRGRCWEREFGALLAFWSYARCQWFMEEGLTGRNLWAEFAHQDPGKVRQRLAAVPREGCRPRGAVPKKKVAERLEEFVEIAHGFGSSGAGAGGMDGLNRVGPGGSRRADGVMVIGFRRSGGRREGLDGGTWHTWRLSSPWDTSCGSC